MNKQIIKLEILWPVIDEVISTGGEFRLFPRGTSMMPLLREGIDSVILVSPNNVDENDIVLYKRDSGQFVLHRIVKIKKDEYIMCGDNQFILEYGIKRENILAKVSSFYRAEEHIDNDNEKYLKYLKSLPRVRFKRKIRAKLGALKRKIIKK